VKINTNPNKRDLDRLRRALEPRIDWRAYFFRFSTEHGGDPVQFEGRLLWADGWGHSATDYRGPEYPPPEDPVELARLARAYWQERRRMVTAERRLLSARLENLESLQRGRSVALQQRELAVDERSGTASVVTGDLDLSALRGRLAWLGQDAADCERKLTELVEREETLDGVEKR